MPAEKALTKTEWLAAFSVEAERLRGFYNSKRVAAAALLEWVQHRDEDPAKIAAAWAKRTGAVSKEP